MNNALRRTSTSGGEGPEEFGLRCFKETVGDRGSGGLSKHVYKEGEGRAFWQKGQPEIGIGVSFGVGSQHRLEAGKRRPEPLRSLGWRVARDLPSVSGCPAPSSPSFSPSSQPFP